VSETPADQIGRGNRVALRDVGGVLIAVLEVGDIWRPDKAHETQQVFGMDDPPATSDWTNCCRWPVAWDRATDP